VLARVVFYEEAADAGASAEAQTGLFGMPRPRMEVEAKGLWGM
jgi:hypothetical protein